MLTYSFKLSFFSSFVQNSGRNTLLFKEKKHNAMTRTVTTEIPPRHYFIVQNKSTVKTVLIT
ncbi:hypothetical protein HMPREF1173_01086 [Prevotella nigrescens CC14M]|uniref:Uncharacterized protein n=1 Tax=Prevotella nigrescens CC14M TaxID=1073366 RepID=V8CP85_9BACT|nr:hypothetical protein HMPREF1173_01086 [Prevotella nigrescens CC14M]